MNRNFFVGLIFVFTFFVLGLSFSGCAGTGNETFISSTNDTIANDESTLGLVGTEVSSNNTNVATAVISNGKISITSVAEGTAVITITKNQNQSATINITISKTGSISIGNINKYSATNQFEGTYSVTIGTLTHGKIVANPTSGVEGTEINLTVTPEENYQLKEGTLKYGTTAIDETTKKFNLPASDVMITAEFELIPYDGQVYNMHSSGREALTNLPDGDILAKSDYSWDDDHDEDTDSDWWLKVGTITSNKITISLPENVDDTFFRGDGHNKFSASFKLGVTGPRKRFFLAKNFVDVPDMDIDWPTERVSVLYVTTVQNNYMIDDEEPELILDLDAGWNYYIRTEGAVTKIDSLDTAYKNGFKWYLYDEANE
jgi:hypothetical protein